MRDDLMTAGEVAAIFRVSDKTVYRWLQDGRIDGMRTPGGRWRIWRKSVEALLADFTKATEPGYGTPEGGDTHE